MHRNDRIRLDIIKERSEVVNTTSDRGLNKTSMLHHYRSDIPWLISKIELLELKLELYRTPKGKQNE